MESRSMQSGAVIREDAHVINSLKRISWSAVFAGVLIAVVIQICLSLLGIGIGLSTIDPKTESNPVEGLGIGAAIWYVISSLIAIFSGAWVAGRLSRTNIGFDGMIHGLLTWSLLSLLTLYMVTTTIGSILGGVGRLVGNTLGVVGNVAQKGVEAAAPQIKDQVQNIDLNNLKSEAMKLLAQTGKPQLQPKALEQKAGSAADQAAGTAGNIGSAPQQTDAQVDDLVSQLFSQGKGVAQEVDKEAVVNVIVARTGKSRTEASQIADNWINASRQAAAKVEQTKEQVKAKATEVADDAARAASTAAILTFISLLLGAIVAAFAAKKGTDSKDDEEVVARHAALAH